MSFNNRQCLPGSDPESPYSSDLLIINPFEKITFLPLYPEVVSAAVEKRCVVFDRTDRSFGMLTGDTGDIGEDERKRLTVIAVPLNAQLDLGNPPLYEEIVESGVSDEPPKEQYASNLMIVCPLLPGRGFKRPRWYRKPVSFKPTKRHVYPV